MAVCASCNGDGKLMAHINRGPDSSIHTIEPIACIFCGGSGCEDESQTARRKAGHAWYDRVRRPGELMIEVGIRLGLRPSEVSAIRQGRAPIPQSP